jgi:putative ABC transport system substrate-binding protein
LSGVRQGLADVGLVEGRNLVIERRYADSHPERLSALAMELVRLDVAVLLAPGAVVTRAARSATETIPIVSVTNDSVAFRFCPNLGSSRWQRYRLGHYSQRPTGGEMGRATQRC